MELLLWNVNRGPGKRRLEWIAAQPWDVAILLEVTAGGWKRLDADARWKASGTAADGKGGRRYSVAILTSNGHAIEEHASPLFDTLEGKYQERAHAVGVTVEGVTWTLAGIHMPNSVQQDGRRNHDFKDACYRALSAWANERRSAGPLVVGMDTNRGDWSGSTGDLAAEGQDAQRFLRDHTQFGLRDVHEHAPGAAKPATYWTTRGGQLHPHYYDRILVNQQVAVTGGPTILHALGKPGPDRLSDHAPVTVSLEVTAR